ncbi:hypothetical protein EST38_g9113 [Candolleomyces aberdarensis]|uniref:DUF1996 domain-containing protein n=1 Tax=Candolleomyces aberdarensis TaxID=2316362 RepID=A0A4Q2DCJ2_9AGAR|nr:hypothetical protein EST38_g9113 [Candolleomyces aberdarensis]
MYWTSLLAAVTLAIPSVHGFIRFGCSNLVTERFDPLVTPGQVSPHVHQVVGGNRFDLAMDPNEDFGATATCTTCRFKEDKSNYWTAVLYFRHRNGSYIRVPQMANHNTGPGLQSGGMTVYYFQPSPPTKDLNITSFAKGFRMLVGNPMRRSNDIDPSTAAAQATTFRCFQGTSPGAIGAPGTPPEDTFSLPNKICTGGIRSNIYFPQCWNGKDLDPADHQSHVAHPVGNGFFGTDCPASHPVRLPLLFMEINWDTRPFNDPKIWPKDGSQPFVFSMGDPTGYGQHADYVFGWEGDSLKRAMDVCTGADGLVTKCSALTVQTTEEMNNCRVPVKVKEVIEDKYLKQLPGCNPIQRGPGYATIPKGCNALSTTFNAPSPTYAPAVVTPPWTVCNAGPTPEPLTPACDSIPGEKPPAPVVTPPPA